MSVPKVRLSSCFKFFGSLPTDSSVYSCLRLCDERSDQQLHDDPSGATSSPQQVQNWKQPRWFCDLPRPCKWRWVVNCSIYFLLVYGKHYVDVNVCFFWESLPLCWCFRACEAEAQWLSSGAESNAGSMWAGLQGFPHGGRPGRRSHIWCKSHSL